MTSAALAAPAVVRHDVACDREQPRFDGSQWLIGMARPVERQKSVLVGIGEILVVSHAVPKKSDENGTQVIEQGPVRHRIAVLCQRHPASSLATAIGRGIVPRDTRVRVDDWTASDGETVDHRHLEPHIGPRATFGVVALRQPVCGTNVNMKMSSSGRDRRGRPASKKGAPPDCSGKV
jgi:hypothetical protein